MECDANARDRFGIGPEATLAHGVMQPVEDVAAERFGRAPLARELRHIVEVAVIERTERSLQRVVGRADVDDNVVRAELLAEKCDIDDESRAVNFLRRAKEFALQAVGDHDVVADLDGVHGE